MTSRLAASAAALVGYTPTILRSFCRHVRDCPFPCVHTQIRQCAFDVFLFVFCFFRGLLLAANAAARSLALSGMLRVPDRATAKAAADAETVG